MIKKNLAINKEHALFQISLKVLLRNSKGRILILRSKPGSMLRKSWDFPGGRIDTHELRRPLAALLKREVREEIGNKVRFTFHNVPIAYGRLIDLPKRYGNHPPIFYVFFEAAFHGGEISISSEHSGYAWIIMTNRSCSRYFTGVMREVAQQYLQYKHS